MSFLSSSLEKLFYMTILSWYGMEEVFDSTEVLLEETLLGEGDLSLALSKLLTFLVISMSIAKLASKYFIWEAVDIKAKGENYIFPKTLLGVIM